MEMSFYNFFDKNLKEFFPMVFSLHLFALSFFIALILKKVHSSSTIGLQISLSSLCIGFLILTVVNKIGKSNRTIDEGFGQNRYQNNLWQLSSLILIFMIPLFLLYPAHPALKGYASYLVLITYGGCALFLRWINSLPRSDFESLLRMASNKEKIIVPCGIIFYTLILFAMAKIKYQNFGGYNPDDAAFYKFFLNVSRGIWHGDVYEGTTLLTWHIDFLIYPFAMLFSLWPIYDTFLLIKVGMIGLSAIPLYLIIRNDHDPLTVMLIVGAYLFFHQIAGASVADFHEVVFAPFFLLFTFYFYKHKRFPAFIVFMWMSLLIKENITVVIFSFFLYALVERRDWKWLLAPLASSIGWLFITMKVLLPYFGSNYYIHGKCMDRLMGYVRDPYTLVRMLTRPRILANVYTFFQPFLFGTPFLAKEIIFVIPWFVLALLMGGNEQIRTWHYLIIIGFGFIALSSSLGNMKKLVRNERVIPSIAAVVFFISLSCSFYWIRSEEFFAKPYLEAQKMAVRLIPKNARVCAPESMIVYLQDRKEARNELAFQKGIVEGMDFIIFDSHIDRYYLEWKNKDVTPQFIRELRKLAPERRRYSDFEFYWEKDGIFIYKSKEYGYLQ
jgi:uncharacterized membrane protein